MALQLIAFLVVAYLLAGLVRVLKDFASTDVTSSPEYALRRNWLKTVTIAILWPVFPIYYLVEQRRRLRFKHILLYLTNAYWGLGAYASSILGFTGVLNSESDAAVKMLKIVGILVFLALAMLWLYSRHSRGKRKIRESKPSAFAILIFM